MQQIQALKNEVDNLKALLIAHKDCPVTQQQGLSGVYMPNSAVDVFQGSMAYSMSSMPNQQAVLSGQPRRYS